MAPAPATAAALDDVLTRLTQVVPNVGNAYNLLVARINIAIVQAPPAVRGGVLLLYKSDIEGELSRSRTELQKVNDWFGEVIRESTPLVSLLHASNGWLAIRKTVSGLEGITTEYKNPNLVQWEGEVAKYYRAPAPNGTTPQASALKGMSQNADKISEFLVGTFTRNVEYLMKLVDLVVGIVGQLAEIATNVISIVGILEAVAAFADLVSKIIEDAWKVMRALADDVKDFAKQVREASSNVLNDNGRFPGGHWPQLVRNKYPAQG